MDGNPSSGKMKSVLGICSHENTMFSAVSMAILVPIFLALIYKIYCWLRRPQTEMQMMMYRQGISGPNPKFLLGNLLEMKKITDMAAKMNSPVDENLEPRFFPYFVEWKKKYGKKFVYWLGMEAVLYIQEPELINEISSSGSFNWGRPAFLKSDRFPLFGNGLIMAEDQDWLHQRRVVVQALTAEKVKGMLDTVLEACGPVLDEWAEKMREGGNGCCVEIDVEGDLNKVSTQVISKLLFGSSYGKGFQILDKLKLLQHTIFRASRFVGIPGISRLAPNKKARDLGAEADFLIMELIEERLQRSSAGAGFGDDLLGLLLSETKTPSTRDRGLKNYMTTQDVVDECKTLLLAGQETTKLSLTWTMMLLALNPVWQDKVRVEVMEITGGTHYPDINMLARMKNMTIVLKESMRLYPPVSYTVRQAKQNVQLGSFVIPKGLSVFINIVGLHGDPDIWGEDDAYEFNPERFHVMSNSKKNAGGFIPFGFGGRICPGEKLAHMEQKAILSMILSKFSFSISPNYKHSPTSLLSIMPSNGMQLLFHRI